MASGTFGYGAELAGKIDYSPIGAVVTKTVTKQPRKGNPQPRLLETSCGLINSIGLHNPGIERFLTEYLPLLRGLGCAVIVSVAGDTEEEVSYLADRLGRQRVDGIELNLSCPNLGKSRMPAEEPETAFRFVRAAKSAAGATPVLAKLSPNVTDICAAAVACEKAGADGLVLINTVKALAVDIDARRVLRGGYSGPGIKPVGLRAVYEAFRAVSTPIIGCGGIASGQDALEYLLCGARCVAVGSAGFAHPGLAREIVAVIRQYLRRHRLRLRDIVGLLHEGTAGRPARG